MPNNRIYLCLAHMSEAGLEQKYIKEAFETNWVVPLGPNVNAFEKDLEESLWSEQARCRSFGRNRCSAPCFDSLRREAWRRSLRAELHILCIEPPDNLSRCNANLHRF